MPVVIKSSLAGIAAAIPGALAEADRETAADILNLAQQLVPVKTGQLRDSGFTEQRGPLWIVGFRANYAVWIEYGSSRSVAQPFLTPAVRAIDLTFRARERVNALIASNRV